MKVLNPNIACIGYVAMRQCCLLDARVTDVKVFQFVVIQQVENIQACGVVVVSCEVFTIIGVSGKPQILLIVGEVAVEGVVGGNGCPVGCALVMRGVVTRNGAVVAHVKITQFGVLVQINRVF